MTVDIAFIIVNYNTRGLLETLVMNIKQLNLPCSFTITVVDNNSCDGSLDNVSQDGSVSIIRNINNMGYGAAANLGVAATESRYICVLNTDIILNRDALVSVISFLDHTPSAGVCSPVVRFPDGSFQIFLFNLSPVDLLCEMSGRIYRRVMEKKMRTARGPLRVDGISGACLFLRRSFVDGQKLFDEDFFFYYEDNDLAHRWHNRGIGCYALPDVSIIHIGGQSGRRNDEMYYRNRYIYIGKHYGSKMRRIVAALDRFKVFRRSLPWLFLDAVMTSEKSRMKVMKYRELAGVLERSRVQS